MCLFNRCFGSADPALLTVSEELTAAKTPSKEVEPTLETSPNAVELTPTEMSSPQSVPSAAVPAPVETFLSPLSKIFSAALTTPRGTFLGIGPSKKRTHKKNKAGQSPLPSFLSSPQASSST